MSNLVGFDDASDVLSRPNEREYYRAEEGGDPDIISLCWLDEEDDPVFVREDVHYVQGEGYIKDCEAIRKYSPDPSTKISTLIVHYEDGEARVKEWSFGADKYRQLKSMSGDFVLGNSDLRVDCEDEEFQRLQIIPRPKGAKWKSDEEIRERVERKVEAMKDGVSAGRDLDEDEIDEILG